MFATEQLNTLTFHATPTPLLLSAPPSMTTKYKRSHIYFRVSKWPADQTVDTF
jgi:hypothetical protein